MSNGPQQADIFLIPLLDGSYGAGQVISMTSENTCFCTISNRRIGAPDHPGEIALSEHIAIFTTETDGFQSGLWPITGFEQLPHHRVVDEWSDAGFDGEEPHQRQDAAVVEAFTNATFGLYPWDGFGSADFFTQFLINPKEIPETAVLTSGAPAHLKAKT